MIWAEGTGVETRIALSAAGFKFRRRFDPNLMTSHLEDNHHAGVKVMQVANRETIQQHQCTYQNRGCS